jgi:hypothetical protein
MDVERTREFLLAQQARADARQEQADVRLARIDRRVEAIAKLVQQGMKILAKSSEEQRELRAEVRLIAQAQKKADARMDRLESTVDRFITALREQRGNGRK